MKIAIIYDLPYPYYLGGAQRRFWELARHLAARGHTPSLVCMQMWEGPPELYREGVRYAGACPFRSPFNARGNRSMIQPLLFTWHVYRYLRREPFDLIDCAEMPYLTALAARVAIRGRATKLAVTWHEARGVKGWVAYTGWAGLIAAFFERLLGRLSRHNIAISEDTAERCRRILGIGHMAVVPCGVDVTAAQSLPPGPRIDQILHVGRLVRHKQAAWAIEAFAALQQNRPDCLLKIIGTGYLKADLVALAEGLGLDDRVRFVDGVSEEELWQEYARSQVLLFPSSQEGFGMVLVEAMATGTPVVALDAPNSAAGTILTTGVDGVLVRSQDEMTAALQGLLTDAGLWQSISAGARATARKYDWTPIVDNLERFYQNVVAG